MSNNTSLRPRKRPHLGPVAAGALVASSAAALIVGVGLSAASASTTSTASSDTTVIEGFRETIKPWDSITVSSMSCPSGSWLLNKDLSPGRYVPLGVEVVEPGLIGVTITGRAYDEANGNANSAPITGTRIDGAISTATNWDPFGSRELVVKLHCTTDLSKASQKALLNVQ
jgi:hypothetical protein